MKYPQGAKQAATGAAAAGGAAAGGAAADGAAGTAAAGAAGAAAAGAADQEPSATPHCEARQLRKDKLKSKIQWTDSLCETRSFSINEIDEEIRKEEAKLKR